MKNSLLCTVLILGFALAGAAKEKPKETKEPPKVQPIVLTWPSGEHSVVRFTIGPMMRLGSSNGNNGYDVDVLAENLWDKRIDDARFLLQFLDAQGIRVGEREMQLRQIGRGEAAKFRITVGTIGDPVSLRLIAQDLPAELQNFALPKSIQLSVYSVPSGAEIKLDGKPVGTTPQNVTLTTGKHVFDFSKDGFRPGTHTVEVGPNSISGGTITYEMGSAAGDTVELRDGTLLVGDIESLTATELLIRVGGARQNFDRNQVKRILLVQREKPAAAVK